MIGRLPFHSLSPRHPGTRIPSQIRTETAVQSKRGYVASISSASLASSETSIPESGGDTPDCAPSWVAPSLDVAQPRGM